ncbi:GNAT family N-acetyltransferase [Streptomyces pinistramenti]|uniref:GNAT family N-acetyltransferase n=1 Tax=Streptomyces pinistramenti TaxID=2884812 RepID=UPI001D0749D0|nr:GNAT family N-acetyltransferase [Streptomyces pinistramenti]MCB5909687.1 GNAT family N-acetyltransferase [Streptomyces pinistramenti]
MKLATARLSLVPLDPDADAEALHTAYGDPEVMAWWTRPETASAAETRLLLAEDNAQSGAMLWTIRAENDTVVGLVGLLGAVEIPGLTWILAKRAWGRGYATEAAAAVIEHAFVHVGLDRVEAWVQASNTRSLAVCRRLDMTCRGMLAQRYTHQAHPHEVVVLGRTNTRKRQEPSPVLHVEPVLPVADVPATLELLQPILSARVGFAVGEPIEVAGLVLGPWSVGPSLRLVTASQSQSGPVTLALDVGTEFDSLYQRAIEAESGQVEPPVEQPWGVREFVFQLPDGHRLEFSAPA